MGGKIRQRAVAHIAVVSACFIAAIAVAMMPIAARIDHYAYDEMLSWQPAVNSTPHSVVVAIDEQTLSAGHGMQNIRSILTKVLQEVDSARPKAVALDVILHDEVDQASDARLAAALRATRNLILPCDIIITGNLRKWEDPLPEFQEAAVALGHVHLEQAGADGVTRQLPLEEIVDGKRRWALALEAFSVAQGSRITESPDDLQVGSVAIPSRRATGRQMLIRYRPSGVPIVSALAVGQNREFLRGKTVFLGITALSAARDRVVIPYGQEVPGLEIHAQAFETIAAGRFLTPAADHTTWTLCVLLAIAAGLTFSLLSGWPAYGLGVLLLTLAFGTPLEFFRNGIVFSFFAPVSVAWLCTAGAASFQHFYVRKQLRRSESEKSRYQQAIHWAAHEMRTPLTAIQGSSEIMTRYALPEEKRHQLGEMINSESKRLARMIQTFLDVERLADGQMELKREPFAAAGVVETCIKRAGPIAERKQISILVDTAIDGGLIGDRELMEYAFYNLLTNAVKYSPAGTEVHVFSELRGGELRLAVRDQGIGMDAKELKSIFKKFYRTKRAEASGEVGTGIGLSIVEQIVAHHRGRIEVSSEPGKGSCFTMILMASEVATQNAETFDRRR